MVSSQPAPECLCKVLWHSFVAIFDLDHLKKGFDIHGLTCRGTCAVILAYYIGFFFLNKSAIASGTAALLISPFTGSALQKNMGRLQAVVIGNILPHIFTQV